MVLITAKCPVNFFVGFCCRYCNKASNTFLSLIFFQHAFYIRRRFSIDCQLWSLCNIDRSFKTDWQGAKMMRMCLLSSVGIGRTETVPVPTCWPEKQSDYRGASVRRGTTIHTHVHTCRQFRLISQPGRLVLPGFSSAVAKGYLERLKWSPINLRMDSLESAITLNSARMESWCANGQKVT